MKSVFQHRSPKLPLTFVAVLLVVLTGLLAAFSLHILKDLNRRFTHQEAAQTVIEKGRLLVRGLALQPMVRKSSKSPEDWRSFSRQIRSLHSLEDGLQYVQVSKNGVIVFHEQTRSLDGVESRPAEAVLSAQIRDIRMTRKLLTVGEQVVPVVVFATRIQGEDGSMRLLELALRKESVAREESLASAAIASMFRVSLWMVVVAFAICAVIVVWMMRREHGREQQRREEEHLAFAGVLANGIVHDFRNPMSAMRLDAQMLKKETLPGQTYRAERVHELADRVQNTIDRLDTVFQEFLYVSKPPSEEKETVDLNACVEACQVMLAARFEKAGVRMELDIPSSLYVVAYQASLQRALMNVLTNAEQASPPGEVVIVRVREAGGKAVLDIVDNGPGIPESERGTVFDMFYTTRPEGSGLGLFLARAAIERCGGTIEAREGDNGKGACIRILLMKAEKQVDRTDPTDL